jgi:CP family cyanate transporter-like MFS transporter
MKPTRAHDLHDPAMGRVFSAIALLWLGGVGLRLTILAVPPVIPLIRVDLHLSETGVGILSGLPPVLFALAAVPGSLLIARFGALPTLVTGLLATAVGSALRGIVPSALLLYAATVLTAFGVAIMQPSLPPLVRAWMPHRIGFGTAVYTNGLLVGEIIPVALTIPVLLPLLGGSWRGAFMIWALPCIAIALVVLALAPGRSADAVAAPARRWWPDWRTGLIWRVGFMFGAANSMYFTSNAFIPDHLHHLGRDDLISAALTALNLGQLPASLLLLGLAGRLIGRAWPQIVCAVLCIAGVLGIMFGQGWTIVAAAALFGFADAAAFILILALPPLLSRPDDVHRMSAGMFTISYSCAIVTPIVSGLAWDLSGLGALAFAPVGLWACALIALAPTVDLQHARQRSA